MTAIPATFRMFLVVACLTCGSAMSASAQPSSLHTLWRAALVEPAPTAWKPREHGGVAVSPSGTYLYAASAAGVKAFVAATGQPLWDLPTPERVDSRPVVHGGVVYAATLAGAVHAVDGRTGRRLWREPARLESAVQAPLAADDSHVYVVADPGSIAAIGRVTGKPVWRHNAEIIREFLVEGQGGPLAIGGLVYVGLPSGKLLALAARDGGVTWEVALERGERSPYADVDSTPVLVPRSGRNAKAKDGGTPDWLLAASHSGGLFALAAADGGQVWHYDAEALGQPVVHQGRVYAVSAVGELHVVDLETGRRIVARRLGGGASGTVAVTSAGIALVPTETGLDAVSMWTGRGVQRSMVEAGFFAAPAVVGDLAYAVSNGGVLYAFALR